MKIFTSDIPNDIIERYCRLVKIQLYGGQYSAQLDAERAALHNKIYEIAGHHRSLYTQADRDFTVALNVTVGDLIFGA